MQKEKIRNSILGILAFVLLFYEIIVLKGENYYLVCFLPVFSGFCLVWTRKHFVAVKHFVYHYLITPKKSSAYTTESE